MRSFQIRALRRRYGEGVLGWLDLADAGLETEDRLPYIRSEWLPVWAALRGLRLGPDDVVADIGCGKGVIVLLAAEHPVRRVVGVELSADLAEDARRNVDANRARIGAGEVEIVAGDVLDWDVPADLSTVYLYSPVVGDTFHRMIGRLREGARGPLRLIYNYPWEHNWLVRQEGVQVLDVRPAEWPPGRRWWERGEVLVQYDLRAGAPAPRVPRWRRRALARWSAPNDTRFVIEIPGRPPRWSEEG